MTGAAMKNLLVIAVIVLGFAGQASAAGITGTLNMSGTVTVTADTIDWADDDGIPNLVKAETSTEYFGALDSGASPTYASSIDLTAPTQTVPDFLSDFTENPVDLPTEYDNLTFDLDDIIEPTAPPCLPNTSYGPNTSCSLGFFTLTSSADALQTTITLDIRGNFDDPDVATDVPAIGIYSTQKNQTIRSIVDIFLPGGAGTFTTSYSLSITAVPEPATLLTFGVGTALLAAHRRRRSKKNNG